MTIDQFKTVLRQHPFRPFTNRMVDGQTFPVTHPDFAAPSPTGRTVVVYQPDDSFSVLDLLLMTELQAANGQPF